ncbi:MAG: SGNH/GDSL hydrolase family protein [Acidobacteriota bacterium]|nr:SGNH/GDSL hydrolase family protein [Acidobacteriota bacterium]
MKRYLQSAATLLLVAVIAVPVFAARGSADFTRFVALGDSYGAGFQSGSLNQNHQQWSWPAVVAKQAGLRLCTPADSATAHCFAQPLVSFPGIANELILQSIAPSAVITAAPGQGQPLMLNFARPYNNLAVPGATVGALLAVRGNEPPSANEPTVVSFGRFILRGLGSQVEQAVAQHPTFIALWIGGNDYLNTIFSGDPATLTPAADFKVRYEAVLDSLIVGAPNAGMVVGNLPTGVVPYLRLIPPFVVNPSTGQPLLVDPNTGIPSATGVPLFYLAKTGQKDAQGNDIVAPIAPTTLVPLGTREKLAQGYGLPPLFKNFPPFNSLPHTGEPLLPGDVITVEEYAAVVARVAEYNAIINAAASARQIPVADVAGLFSRVFSATGHQLGPITVTAAPVSGGFFNLDFFHLTDLGYLLMGNEFIKAINAGYDTEIPLASIAQLYANNGAFFGDGTPDASNLTFTGSNNGITDEAVRQIVTMWAQPTVRKIRLRAITH